MTYEEILMEEINKLEENGRACALVHIDASKKKVEGMKLGRLETLKEIANEIMNFNTEQWINSGEPFFDRNYEEDELLDYCLGIFIVKIRDKIKELEK